MDAQATIDVLVNELAMAHAERHEISARADADKDLFVEEKSFLQMQLKVLQSQLPSNDRDKSDALGGKNVFSAELEPLRDANARLRRDNDKWRTQFNRLQDEYRKLEHNGQVPRLRSKLKRAKAENVTLADELKNVDSKLCRATLALDNAVAEASSARAALAQEQSQARAQERSAAAILLERQHSPQQTTRNHCDDSAVSLLRADLQLARSTEQQLRAQLSARMQPEQPHRCCAAAPTSPTVGSIETLMAQMQHSAQQADARESECAHLRREMESMGRKIAESEAKLGQACREKREVKHAAAKEIATTKADLWRLQQSLDKERKRVDREGCQALRQIDNTLGRGGVAARHLR